MRDGIDVADMELLDQPQGWLYDPALLPLPGTDEQGYPLFQGADWLRRYDQIVFQECYAPEGKRFRKDDDSQEGLQNSKSAFFE